MEMEDFLSDVSVLDLFPDENENTSNNNYYIDLNDANNKENLNEQLRQQHQIVSVKYHNSLDCRDYYNTFSASDIFDGSTTPIAALTEVSRMDLNASSTPVLNHQSSPYQNQQQVQQNQQYLYQQQQQVKSPAPLSSLSVLQQSAAIRQLTTPQYLVPHFSPLVLQERQSHTPLPPVPQLPIQLPILSPTVVVDSVGANVEVGTTSTTGGSCTPDFQQQPTSPPSSQRSLTSESVSNKRSHEIANDGQNNNDSCSKKQKLDDCGENNTRIYEDDEEEEKLEEPNDKYDDDDDEFVPTEKEIIQAKKEEESTIVSIPPDTEQLDIYPLETKSKYVIKYSQRMNKLLSNTYDISISLTRKILSRNEPTEFELNYMNTIKYTIPREKCAFAFINPSCTIADTGINDDDTYKVISQKLIDNMQLEQPIHRELDKYDLMLSTYKNGDDTVALKSGSASFLKHSENNVVWFDSYSESFTEVKSVYEACYSENNSENMMIQDVFTYVQENYSKNNNVIREKTENIAISKNLVRIYRSALLNDVILGIVKNVKFARNSATNSCGDFTTFRYDCEYIRCEQFITLESFLYFLLRYRDPKAQFDIYEGEWVFILRSYWDICTQDLKNYNENKNRREEKSILGYVMRKIYSSIMRENMSTEKYFRLLVASNAIRKLKCRDKTTVPLEFLEYIKHYISLLSNNISSKLQMMWSSTFKKMGIHHANFVHTFVEVMKRRKFMLAFALRCVYQKPLPIVPEKTVNLDQYIKFWSFRNDMNHVKVLKNKNISVPEKLISRFRAINNGCGIDKTQINYILNSIFDNEADISDRLQCEFENFYHFFVEMFAEYIYNIKASEKISDHLSIEFFNGKMSPIKKIFLHVNCVTCIYVTFTMSALITDNIKRCLKELSPNGHYENLKFSKSVVSKFFAMINENLTYALYPVLVQYGKNHVDKFSMNAMLINCFDSYRDTVINCFGIGNIRFGWYVESMSNLDIDYSPKVINAFTDAENLWSFVNALSVIDYDDVAYTKEDRNIMDVDEELEESDDQRKLLNDRVDTLLPILTKTGENNSFKQEITACTGVLDVFSDDDSVYSYEESIFCSDDYESDVCIKTNEESEIDPSSNSSDDEDCDDGCSSDRFDERIRKAKLKKTRKLFIDNLKENGMLVDSLITSVNPNVPNDYSDDDDVNTNQEIIIYQTENKKRKLKKKKTPVAKKIDPISDVDLLKKPKSGSCSDASSSRSSSSDDDNDNTIAGCKKKDSGCSSGDHSSDDDSNSSSSNSNSSDSDADDKTTTKSPSILPSASTKISKTPSISKLKKTTTPATTTSSKTPKIKSIVKLNIPLQRFIRPPNKPLLFINGKRMAGKTLSDDDDDNDDNDGVLNNLTYNDEVPQNTDTADRSTVQLPKPKPKKSTVETSPTTAVTTEMAPVKQKMKYVRKSVAGGTICRRKEYHHYPDVIYPSTLNKAGCRVLKDNYDYRTMRVDECIKKYLPELKKFYDRQILTDKNNKYFNTKAYPESYGLILMPNDYFKNYDKDPENFKDKYYTSYNDEDGIKKRLFMIQLKTAIENGKASKNCVLCHTENRTSFNMIVTRECVITACFYCVHFINLHIIHNIKTYEDVRRQLYTRVEKRYGRIHPGVAKNYPLMFDEHYNYIENMPKRTVATQINMRTYNKRKKNYRINLKKEEAIRLLDVEL
ncbi:uncharacterized protein LOC112595712 [Melanaphis sacchari]|uniref:uncharacterized protein LOC112595712 n=1 Tax=Melanaphis sacchari TaxID=742174 RepID=UPI000DC133DA|nr:uncharacterized protein LOC112595712 [Melanaphis sacchari]